MCCSGEGGGVGGDGDLQEMDGDGGDDGDGDDDHHHWFFTGVIIVNVVTLRRKINVIGWTSVRLFT